MAPKWQLVAGIVEPSDAADHSGCRGPYRAPAPGRWLTAAAASRGGAGHPIAAGPIARPLPRGGRACVSGLASRRGQDDDVARVDRDPQVGVELPDRCIRNPEVAGDALKVVASANRVEIAVGLVRARRQECVAITRRPGRRCRHRGRRRRGRGSRCRRGRWFEGRTRCRRRLVGRRARRTAGHRNGWHGTRQTKAARDRHEGDSRHSRRDQEQQRDRDRRRQQTRPRLPIGREQLPLLVCVHDPPTC